MTLLEMREVCKRFKDTEAVRGVSFSVESGEALGLVGESGSGKSTLAKMAAGLLAPDKGKIIALAGKTQIVFQNPFSSFDPRLTMADSLKEALRLGGERSARLDERVRELFALVELPKELASRRPHQLSGGECQRIAIARALSRDPELLICDEPVSSLDLIAQAKTLNLFLKLQKQRQLALLFISHDLRVIRHLCDRVLVMREGVICEEGQLSQVFERAQHPYTQELLLSSGILPKP